MGGATATIRVSNNAADEVGVTTNVSATPQLTPTAEARSQSDEGTERTKLKFTVKQAGVYNVVVVQTVDNKREIGKAKVEFSYGWDIRDDQDRPRPQASQPPYGSGSGTLINPSNPVGKPQRSDVQTTSLKPGTYHLMFLAKASATAETPPREDRDSWRLIELMNQRNSVASVDVTYSIKIEEP